MGEIRVLDKSTVDKIAAGEVVERPASVVKELVENAIDAGAGAITVEIRDGGIELIRVTDNGAGIGTDQAPMAFLRHATSKIATDEDLFHISSLGFRGEALSSIAAVAKVELVTKTRTELTGLRYVIEAGEEKEREEVGAPDGTTFLVRNLFFNTPARRKFLKQPQTEGSYISELMERLALSHPHIAFKYLLNRQLRFHTSGSGDLKEIIYRIYGREIAGALVEIHADTTDAHVDGYIGRPEINRSNRNFETFFVNGRAIRSTLLAKALEEGYHRYLMQHKFPFAVLHYTVDAALLDVNVHPSKMEVRFTNPSAIYQLTAETVLETLRGKELIPEVTLQTAAEKKKAEAERVKQDIPEPFEEKRLERSQVREITDYQAEITDKASNVKDFIHNTAFGRVIGSGAGGKDRLSESNHANIIKAGERVIVEKPVQIDFFEEKMLTCEARQGYRILGQIFDTYWLVAFQDKLFFIDQHAAHEKIKYENLRKQLQEKKVPSQMLNPPVIVALTGREEELLNRYEIHFRELGFETESFGGKEYAIRGVPADLYGCNEREMFLSMLDGLSETAPPSGAPEVIEDKLASMACKAAVKGNTSLSPAEMEALIDQLLELDDPYHCPHGRPTILSMSKYEIEKKFKRVL